MTILSVLACTVLLACGHYYWKNKTTVSAQNTVNEKASGKVVKTDKAGKGSIDLSPLSSKWPKEAQESFKQSIADGRKFKFAIVGSESLGKETGGWSILLSKTLRETFGDNRIEVRIFEYPVNSLEFAQQGHMGEVAQYVPDLVLFEPFNENDNGFVNPEDNHATIMSFISALKAENNTVSVIIQPSHPKVSVYYPGQVQELEQFAEREGLPYINHWPNWPDTDNNELRNYVENEQSTPNEKGHAIWFETLKEYFIAEKQSSN